MCEGARGKIAWKETPNLTRSMAVCVWLLLLLPLFFFFFLLQFFLQQQHIFSHLLLLYQRISSFCSSSVPDRARVVGQTRHLSKAEAEANQEPRKAAESMHGGGALVEINGKDGAARAAAGSRTTTTLPAVKLLRPTRLLAVVLAAAVLLLFLATAGSSSSYYRLPRLALPDVVLAERPPCAPRREEAERWWARPAPVSAWHNMTDEELLWAASFEPRRRLGGAGYPYRRVPKVAFLFLTRGPLPLAPLWERFFNSAGDGGRDLFSVYVHTTPGYRLDFPPSSAFHRRQIPSKVARWGQTSMIEAERRLVANALLDGGNERFVLVSESCVPLYGFPAVYSHLTRSRRSFVGSFDDLGPHGRGRYRAGLAPEVTPSQWRKGAQWFELDRSLALFVVADERYYPKFRDLCRPPCYVDEHYLPTVLSIEAPRRIANRTVTWVDWSRGGAHPATFGGADVLEKLLVTEKGGGERCMYNGQPTEVCFLFARKFAPSALQPLLRLAPKLLGY